MTASQGRALALAVAATVFFTNLGAAGLFDEDEPKNAACAQEMFVRGDWIVPSFNHELRTDKPILVYWLMLASFHVWGVSEFSARLPSAACATLTAALVYGLGARLYRPAVGLAAAVVLATTLMYDVVARAATPDATLIACTTLGLYAFVRATGRGSAEPSRSQEDDLPSEWRLCHQGWTIAMYAALGLAVLAKGPVGVVLPVTALIVFLAWIAPRRSPTPRPIDGGGDEAGAPAAQSSSPAPVKATPARRVLATLSTVASRLGPTRVGSAAVQLRPFVGLAVVALVAGPWYAAVAYQTDGQWLAGFLGRHNLERFVAPMEGHGGPPFYHLLSIGIGFFPWSALFVVSLPAWRTRLNRTDAARAPDLLLAAWVATYVLFFSLARTKLPNYVLPAYPALALATGAWLADAWDQPAGLAKRWLRLGLGVQAGVGLGLLVGFPLAAWWVLPGEGALGLVGLVPLVGGGWAWWCVPRRPRRALAAVVVMAVSFSLAIFGWGAVRVARHQTSAEFVRLARDFAGGEAQLASWELFEPSLVFYATRRVERPADPDQIAQFFAAHSDGYLVTRADRLDRLAKQLPADVRELARRRRFLRTHDLVLLGRENRLARHGESPPRD